jgi:lipopolysaccharide transport system ATP-binding protein
LQTSSRPHAVEVEDLSKAYELGELASLNRTVRAIGRRALFRKDSSPAWLQAVKDVSFSIQAGECFTLVGSNGSGKSTVARMIAGITLPTTGQIRVRGRVLPLLNVGSAFHPDLTASENITLFGTILGLDRRETAAAVPEIATFAAIDRQHLETPIKRHSEGMRARLAFATALRLPADLYIFDEVLVVADDEFKAACVAEISRLARDGRTVLFISHELALVRAVCTRGLWLDEGRVRLVGDVEDVLGAYEASHPASEN